MSPIKRIPYGVSNFIEVMKQDQYYVDKTMYLPLLEEQPDSLFFTRPRRFGKSLFINMLRAYYDINRKAQFEELFGGLWIGSRPTPSQGRYQILYFDFSKVGGDIDTLQKDFGSYCNMVINAFADSYYSFYESGFQEELRALPTYMEKLNFLGMRSHAMGHHLYLIIDEYDNFTNVVLNEQGEEMYHALTHASGFYREVFKLFKGTFERIFITGVSPVTLDDLTSGFNIGWNISINPHFNGMLGFSETEVRIMFNYYREAGALQGDIEAMIAEMKPWYNNYCFAEECLSDAPKIFNSDMVLYYLQNYLQMGRAPKQMIDPNTRTDYCKLQRLMQLDRLESGQKGILFRIAEEGGITTELYNTFPAHRLTDEKIFPSLLFYYGMLTLVGVYRGQTVLGIPNNNVRKQYYEYMLQEYQQLQSLDLSMLNRMYGDMAYEGKWRTALTEVSDAYQRLSSLRDSIEGERNIQGFFTAYLSICPYYLTAPEMELNHGYCDFFLMPERTHYGDVTHSYILELKYLPMNASDTKATQQWEEAVVQIRRYIAAPRVTVLAAGTHLHAIVLQFKGWQLIRMEEID